MIKRKKICKAMKKILPMVFAVFVLSVMMVVSASAIYFSEVGFCECFTGAETVIPNEDLKEGTREFSGEVTCSNCGKTFVVNCITYEDIEPKTNLTYIFHFEVLDGEIYGLALNGYTDVTEESLCGYELEFVSATEKFTDMESGSMVGQMVSAVTTAIGSLLSGVGATIVAFFEATVLSPEGGLTTLAIWVLSFLGIGIAFMVIRHIIKLVRK